MRDLPCGANFALKLSLLPPVEFDTKLNRQPLNYWLRADGAQSGRVVTDVLSGRGVERASLCQLWKTLVTKESISYGKNCNGF